MHAAFASVADPLPARIRGRSLGGPGFELVLQIIFRCPWARISLFEGDWAEVDRSRALVSAHGLDGLVAVHHVHAWRWSRCPFRTAA